MSVGGALQKTVFLDDVAHPLKSKRAPKPHIPHQLIDLTCDSDEESNCFQGSAHGSAVDSLAAALSKLAVGSPDIPPPLLNGYDYLAHQRVAIQRCLTILRSAAIPNVMHRGGCLLAAEPGLGKTLIAIACAICVRRKDTAGTRCSLILCPKTVIVSWKETFCKFFGELYKWIVLHPDEGTDPKRLTVELLNGHDFAIVSYNTLVSRTTSEAHLESSKRSSEVFIPSLEKAERLHTSVSGSDLLIWYPWHMIIADESQTFSNKNTQCFKACMRLPSSFRMCLSGTPVRNKEEDISTQLKFLGLIPSITESSVDRLRSSSVLGSRVVILTYEEAAVKLPEVAIDRVLLQNTVRGYSLHSEYMRNARSALESFEKRQRSYAAVLSEITRLRQVCIAPYLISPSSRKTMLGELASVCSDLMLMRFETLFLKMAARQQSLQPLEGDDGFASDNDSSGANEDEHDRQWLCDLESDAGIRSPKMIGLLKILSVVPDSEKVIIFSSFSKSLYLAMLAIHRHDLHRRKRLCFIDGTVIGENRESELQEFCCGQANVLLMTYKVGGEGLNISQASHCVFLEPWWCPAVHTQALARVQRIGQTRTVTKYELVMQDSIESRIFDVCDEKYRAVARTMGAKSVCSRSAGLSKDDIKRILGEHHAA
eukprot:ANDGO_05071.mRNA.1 Putative helicase 172L